MRTLLFLFAVVLPAIFLQAQDRARVDSLLRVIDTLKDQKEVSKSYVRLGNTYRKATLADSALYFGKKGLPHALQSKDPETLAYNYLFLGAVEYYRWNMGEAMDYYQKTDSILTTNNIKSRHLLISILDRAELFRRSSDDTNQESSQKKALMYYKRGLELAQHLKDSTQIGNTLMRMASSHSTLKDYDKAQYYMDQVNEYYLKFLYKGHYHSQYASLFLAMKDTLNYLKQSELMYEIKGASSRNFERAVGQWSYSRALAIDKKYTESIALAKRSSDFFSGLTPPDYGRLSSLYKSISESYENIGDYKNAYKYVLLNEAIDDSLATKTFKEKGLELETKYESEKKQQEITLLKTENALAEQQKKNQRNLLLGGLGLTTAAGIFLFLGFRNRKKTNDKLRELDTIKSNFFANISHEFRTPLSLIAGPIEEQLQKPDLPAQDKQNLQTAQRNSQRLVSLVDQLLDLSKLEAGHFKLKVQQGKLDTFLKSLGSSFEYLAQEKAQEYYSQIDIPKDDYWFDADALEKIITNLLSNAVKYSPANASVGYHAEVKDGKLNLTIKNSGTTVSKEVLATLFDRFQRADEGQAGSGIGLALTKELVEFHKGSISVTNDSDEMIFKVQLPVTSEAFTEEERYEGMIVPPTDDATSNTLSTGLAKAETSTFKQTEEKDIFSKDTNPILLIVDDNEDLRNYVSSLFVNQYTIHTAENGKTGFATAQEIVPDVIVTDLMMPEEDGLIFTANCKSTAATSHIPILMLTAKAGDENQLVGLETGADSYITKPFNTEILKTTVHNLLDTRKKLQERFSQEVVLLPKDIATSSIEEKFLENLQTVMDENLIESDFSTEDFARVLGMSRMQLHRKLKALTGLSATEFIRKQRLKLAAQLLKKSDINVSSVGYSVGFNNHSYFTKCFKEQYGVAPSEYVKNR